MVRRAWSAFVQRVQRLHRRDWIVAGSLTVLTFFVVQSAFAFGWWHRDTPFPEGTISGERSGMFPRAELRIPDLQIRAPILISQSRKEAALQKDLEEGVSLYPGTPFPGEKGNAVIAGHSSDAFWNPGNFKRVFARLGRLDIGDQGILVVTHAEDGTEIVKEFRVTDTAIVLPSTTNVFEQQEKSELTLVTCWPVGTSWLRLAVTLEAV